MIKTYIGKILRFAFKGFVLRTDGLQIVAASATPAVFSMMGLPMPDDTPSSVYAYIAYAVLAFVGFRLLFAPYFVWKEAETERIRLVSEQESENRRAEDEKIRNRGSRMLEALAEWDAALEVGKPLVSVNSRVNAQLVLCRDLGLPALDASAGTQQRRQYLREVGVFLEAGSFGRAKEAAQSVINGLS